MPPGAGGGGGEQPMVGLMYQNRDCRRFRQLQRLDNLVQGFCNQICPLHSLTVGTVLEGGIECWRAKPHHPTALDGR